MYDEEQALRTFNTASQSRGSNSRLRQLTRRPAVGWVRTHSFKHHHSFSPSESESLRRRLLTLSSRGTVPDTKGSHGSRKALCITTPAARPGRRSVPARRNLASARGDVMNSLKGLRFALSLAVVGIPLARPAAAQTTSVLPSPLSLGDVIRLASERRDEIQAARARVRAGEARPTIVSALEDPMISPSLDHLPFMLGGRGRELHDRATDPVVRHSRAPPRIRAGGCRSAARRGEPDHPGCRHTGGQRLPDGAGAPADRSARLRAARVRARRRQRRECQIRQRNRAAVRRACAPRSRWPGSTRLPARS